MSSAMQCRPSLSCFAGVRRDRSKSRGDTKPLSSRRKQPTGSCAANVGSRAPKSKGRNIAQIQGRPSWLAKSWRARFDTKRRERKTLNMRHTCDAVSRNLELIASRLGDRCLPPTIAFRGVQVLPARIHPLLEESRRLCTHACRRGRAESAPTNTLDRGMSTRRNHGSTCSVDAEPERVLHDENRARSSHASRIKSHI